MLESILPFAVQAQKRSQEDFVREFPDPMLVVEPYEEADGLNFQTITGSGGAGTTQTAARVRKRDGVNAFDMMITIGRARNNDIQVMAQSVSKFHAYVMFGEDGAPTLTDAGSSYGTFLGARRLEPRTERAPLASGDQIRLGAVQATFFAPAAFWEFLRSDEQ